MMKINMTTMYDEKIMNIYVMTKYNENLYEDG